MTRVDVFIRTAQNNGRETFLLRIEFKNNPTRSCDIMCMKYISTVRRQIIKMSAGIGKIAIGRLLEMLNHMISSVLPPPIT